MLKTIKIIIASSSFLLAAQAETIFPGADEASPSRSHYFSWINNTNEGPTMEHTQANLAFFQWLHDEYGMVLDIYAFDAGAVDGPRYYGSPDTLKFKSQFPEGFAPAAEQAAGFGGRLGVWLGPDGFGDSREEAEARIDFLTSLCREHDFALFKMDAVCGQLRDDKQAEFIELMTKVRTYSPDLILLNHRLNLNQEAETHATTSLWEGAETYIDVHMVNSMTATHNRATALSRGLPPELMRLAEDHGVCLSSSLDYWADDLILQGFNRSMILAPQLYGSPWFLRDDEFPKLARIFNLHRRYRDILVDGMVLPEAQYGPSAVSRGDDQTRLVTLRNLTWEPVAYEVALDKSIGLTSGGHREVRLFHPYEEVLGRKLTSADTVTVTVYPFRALLLLATTADCAEPALESGPYRVVKNLDGSEPVIEQLIPLQLQKPWHRKLADLKPTALPKDWVGLYEATMFAADNDSLEHRSIRRSGPTNIPVVQRARDFFFNQKILKDRALSHQYMFDGDHSTTFDVYARNRDWRIKDGCLRVDFKRPMGIGHIRIHTQALEPTLWDIIVEGAEFSSDLVNWTPAQEVVMDGWDLNIYAPAGQWRYFRMRNCPEIIQEIEVFREGLVLAYDGWTANNLFAHPEKLPAVRAWSASTRIDEITPTSYLCVAVEGEHGVEGCYAALRLGDRLIGAPSRAVAYPTNPWEAPARKRDTGYTYFFPLDESMVGKELEVVLLGMEGGGKDLKPSVWLTARELPFRVAE